MACIHLEDRRHKARKEHRCYLCGRVIDQGTAYVRRSGIIEGEGKTNFAMHVDCEEETHDWDVTDWETFSPGDLETWRNQE